MEKIILKEDWQLYAACKGPRASVFFGPIRFERKADKSIREREAKRICASCDVRAECLQFAITNGETHGVWGGVGEEERRRMITLAG